MDQLLEAVRGDLANHHWIFAKTMPTNPHEYTVKREWQRAEEL